MRPSGRRSPTSTSGRSRSRPSRGRASQAIRAITDAVQSLATKKATAGVGFFVAANQEGGLIQGLGGPGFDVIPSALDQGSMTVATLKQKAARWGRELGQAGVNLDLAPVADVVPPGTDASNARSASSSANTATIRRHRREPRQWRSSPA